MPHVDIKVPDIGDFSNVPIIELFVKPGDAIAVNEAICTLESDKATMDVPATEAGMVREILVKVGDRVSEEPAAIEMGADATDIAKTIHPHPTLCESIGMAAEVAEGSCTDLPAAKKKA